MPHNNDNSNGNNGNDSNKPVCSNPYAPQTNTHIGLALGGDSACSVTHQGQQTNTTAGVII